jgi:hypothetical protein
MMASEQERKPLFNVDSCKSKMMGSTYRNLYINQMDPRNKRGGVAWLLLNKGIFAGKRNKENCRSNNTKKLARIISTYKQ